MNQTQKQKKKEARKKKKESKKAWRYCTECNKKYYGVWSNVHIQKKAGIEKPKHIYGLELCAECIESLRQRKGFSVSETGKFR